MAATPPVRPLFIAKSYPPVIGGMELFSYKLGTELQAIGATQIISNPRGPIAMPWFAPWSTAVAAWRARTGKIDLVHMGDALIAPFGRALRLAGDVPVTVTVHGLDVTRETPPGYQALIASAVPHLDHVVAVSASTRDLCLAKWPDMAGRISVIPNGVDIPEEASPASALPRQIAARLDGQPVVLTVGRLVRRKGAAWFVRNVLPRLPPEVIYVIAGEGPDRETIERAVAETGQGDRVVLYGHMDHDQIDALYRRADVFAMPNIVVPNDVEGFGLVSLEAAVRGTPVVAADLQGIPEAVHNGENGLLVPPGDADAFVTRIQGLLALDRSERQVLGERFRAYTVEHLSWRRTAIAYQACFEETVAKYRATPGKHRGSHLGVGSRIR